MLKDKEGINIRMSKRRNPQDKVDVVKVMQKNELNIRTIRDVIHRTKSMLL